MSIKEKIANLIDVKSIVTLLLTVLFFILAVCQIIDGNEVMTIFTTVIAFYFGTQSGKSIINNKESEGKNNEK